MNKKIAHFLYAHQNASETDCSKHRCERFKEKCTFCLEQFQYTVNSLKVKFHAKQFVCPVGRSSESLHASVLQALDLLITLYYSHYHMCSAKEKGFLQRTSFFFAMCTPSPTHPHGCIFDHSHKLNFNALFYTSRKLVPAPGSFRIFCPNMWDVPFLLF